MKPVYWIIILLVAAGIGIAYFTIHPDNNTGTTAVKCGDKTVYRYNNPDQVFPEFTRSYESNYQVTSGVLGKLASDTGNSSIAVSVKNAAQVLIDTLNQQNIFYQTTLKAYFIESNNDPCNEQLRDKYLSFLTEMATSMINLKGFVNDVTTTSSSASVQSDTSKLLAVIDTSQSKVDTTVTNKNNIPANKLVVLKNYAELNKALSTLSAKYKINTAHTQLIPHY